MSEVLEKLSSLGRRRTCTCTQEAVKKPNLIELFSQGPCRQSPTITDWFLVRNGGMGYWDYFRGPQDPSELEDPFKPVALASPHGQWPRGLKRLDLAY